jgi:hypothetical protein
MCTPGSACARESTSIVCGSATHSLAAYMSFFKVGPSCRQRSASFRMHEILIFMAALKRNNYHGHWLGELMSPSHQAQNQSLWDDGRDVGRLTSTIA